ncbi:hypothetical protein, partial [Mycobacterium tuberculosis]|uniref:hypothetical protein n=1 Tax=Mycobacterium tuberculosis TaxID=1773 RepID=UPI001BE4AB0C
MSAGAAVAVQPATTATGAADTPRAAVAGLAATDPRCPRLSSATLDHLPVCSEHLDIDLGICHCADPPRIRRVFT